MNHFMLGAWVARSRDLEQRLQETVAAPALFKAEYVEEVLVNLLAAQAQVRYWLTIGGT